VLPRLSYQRALAKKRFDQVDGQHGRFISHVERGIQFHDIERCHFSGVRDHFHAQLCFPIRQPSRNRRADGAQSEFQLGTDSLEAVDKVLGRIRLVDGISNTETSLLLSTHKY
jgi:hypothetical protein